MPDTAAVPARWRGWRLVLGVALAALVSLVAAFLIWALTPLGPGTDALAALESGDGVTVTQTDDGWVFLPEEADGVPATGLVFYPGGRVDARSYAPLARDLAREGHAVIIVEVPLSLAVFEVDAAASAIASPELAGVERWAVGGHSLGGAMAAQYAAGTPDDEVAGLLLLAAYASGDADLTDSELAVSDASGTLDGVLDREAWEAGLELLPSDAVVISIEGGNHAQFGDYGEQRGDGAATVDAASQLRQAVEAADELLDRM